VEYGMQDTDEDQEDTSDNECKSAFTVSHVYFFV